MVRAGALKEQIAGGYLLCDKKTGLTATEQLSEISLAYRDLQARKECLWDDIISEFAKRGVLSYYTGKPSEYDIARKYFKAYIMPKITPKIVGAYADCFFKNLQYHVIFNIRKDDAHSTVIIPISRHDKRVAIIPRNNDTPLVCTIERLIYEFADLFFEGRPIYEKAVVRVTRNADISASEYRYEHGGGSEDDYFEDIVLKVIEARKLLAPVRVQYYGDNDLVKRFFPEVDTDYIFEENIPFDLKFAEHIRAMCEKRATTVTGNIIRGDNGNAMFYPVYYPCSRGFDGQQHNVLRHNDMLLSLPYESTEPFLELLENASRDPDCKRISVTLYRTARIGRFSDALVAAARNGIEVRALFEFRARFDEENNIVLALRFKKAGIRVIRGPEKYKVHAKLLLIEYRENSAKEPISVVSTGNFNEVTARGYADYMFFTIDSEVTKGVKAMLRALWHGETPLSDGKIISAPLDLREALLTLIAEQSHPNGVIRVKINALTERKIIDALLRASKAGARIDLICRGASCLVAGTEETKNITIKSIVGRFLEHSRIYIFGDKDPTVFLASSDFMTRNLCNRAEAAVRITAPDLKQKIIDDFTLLWDNKAWVQAANATYYKDLSDGSSGQKLLREIYGGNE
jgi:polyphosphate kinase